MMSTHSLAVMDATGDTKTIWNPNDLREVAAARSTFELLKKKGYLIYRVAAAGGKGVAMTEFDPTAEKMIATPALVGVGPLAGVGR